MLQLLQLRLLKSFVALVWSAVAEFLLSNKSTMLWIVDSTPATWPARSCNESVLCTTSFFTTDITALPMILHNTFTISTGMAPGDLFSGIDCLVGLTD